jgi:hypothetical protein
MNPYVGKKYIVIDPEKVVFYQEASLKSETFKLQKSEKIIVESVACADRMNYFLCIGRGLRNADIIFYKISFESGEEGYVSDRYFPSRDYFIDMQSAEYLSSFSFRSEYYRVWIAALTTLDEFGYVITQMSKADGYITTGMKEDTRTREKLSMRLTRGDGFVNVKVNVFNEELVRTIDPPYWRERQSSGALEKMIRDRMALKL